ncbi:MAG TPA: hypothetical protein VGJ95_18600 [Pseudonocardiaceae bacterium]
MPGAVAAFSASTSDPIAVAPLFSTSISPTTSAFSPVIAATSLACWRWNSLALSAPLAFGFTSRVVVK